MTTKQYVQWVQEWLRLGMDEERVYSILTKGMGIHPEFARAIITVADEMNKENE